MARSTYRLVGDLWLPGLVFLAGTIVSLAVWGVLVADRRAQVLETSQATAEETREAMALRLESEMKTLHDLADLWVRFGRRPLPEWQAHAELLIGNVPGLVAVSWIDLDDRTHRATLGTEEDPEALLIATAEARSHYAEPHVAGPFRDAEQAQSFRIFLPVRTREEHAGVLVARVRIPELLDVALRARARGYALAVYWGDALIYSRGEPTAEAGLTWWRAVGSVPLPLAQSSQTVAWRIVQRPTDALASVRLRPTPHYLLAAGLCVSLLLAGLMHLLRRTQRQSRFLGAANRALEASGGELRDLNVELQSRVDARTRELQEAVKELESFNYSVSHDLRSPIGAVLNFAFILDEDYRDRKLDDAGREMLDRIQRSASRANELLEGLLHLSRAGRAALQLEEIDMEDLAHEVWQEAVAAEPSVEGLELVVEPLPAARADRALVAAVLTNLFSNSLKYSRGREKRRVVLCGRPEGAELVFEVRDNGRGFDMRFADKLFGIFERLHAEDEIEGTGVGLALVARIVQRHGGRVWADGRVDEGACFGFSLPADTKESS